MNVKAKIKPDVNIKCGGQRDNFTMTKKPPEDKGRGPR